MSVAPTVSNISIRTIDELSDIRAVEELQREVWQTPDLDVVPLTHLIATKEAGGVLIGAFDEEALVGFIYGFPSYEHGRLCHHSHMLAVKSEYRNLDLGRRLKLAQREFVLAQGIELVTWTFDPLQSLNAYFNFSKLGVISNRYLVNFYGEDASSFLHQTGTDRLWVSWFIASDRVLKRITGTNKPAKPDTGAILVTLSPDGSPQRINPIGGLNDEHAAIEIPGDINLLQQQNPELARKWREETRWAFTQAITSGYTITSFVRESRGYAQVGRYLLSKGDLFTFGRSA